MPEIDNNQAAGEGADQHSDAGEGQDSGADQKKDTDATKTGDEDTGNGEGKEGEGAKDTSKGQDNAKAPTKDTSKDDDTDEPVTRQRMSKQDFIIGRQRAKLAKEQERKANASDNDDTDDDTIAPEDEDLISKVVAKRFAPIIEKSLADDDDREIADFLTNNPDFKPFEAKARRYMQHPSRRQLPVKSIFYEVAGDNLLKIGAERAKAADAKAKDTQTGGGSNRAGEGARSVWDMPDDEFKAKQERVRHGA